jgi:hypothetical protein
MSISKIKKENIMPEWTVTNIQILFDNFMVGLTYIVGFFVFVLFVGIVVEEYRRRKR